MLWYKGWLETRFRLLFTLGIFAAILLLQHLVGGASAVSRAKAHPLEQIMYLAPMLVLMGCANLAGAGIATQTSFQKTKGLHGSTMFTLSLPVSRQRLLTIRAFAGWLEMAAAVLAVCSAMWLLSPGMKAVTTPSEMLEYAATLIGCASAIYCTSVLLATFLDDQWRIWGTMLCWGSLWWLSYSTSIPSFANIFRAMREGSPLLAHSVPWNAVAFSTGLAAILFFAALKVVQRREY